MGLPVKLAVCFVVIGLMTPLVMDAVRDTEDAVSRQHALDEARDLEQAMERAYRSGAGTAVSVHLDIPARQALSVGGDGPDAYTIRVTVDGALSETVYLDSPVMPVLNGRTDLSGSCSVTVVCVSGESGYGLEVRV